MSLQFTRLTRILVGSTSRLRLLVTKPSNPINPVFRSSFRYMHDSIMGEKDEIPVNLPMAGETLSEWVAGQLKALNDAPEISEVWLLNIREQIQKSTVDTLDLSGLLKTFLTPENEEFLMKWLGRALNGTKITTLFIKDNNIDQVGYYQLKKNISVDTLVPLIDITYHQVARRVYLSKYAIGDENSLEKNPNACGEKAKMRFI